jgi:transcriptional regulator with XRE-family HTH domain
VAGSFFLSDGVTAGVMKADTTLGLMNPATERRRQHLRVLASERGGASAMARAIGITRGRLSQLIGANPSGEIGERVARNIEVSLQLPDGWLDRELEAGTQSSLTPPITKSSQDALSQLRLNLLKLMREHNLNQSELARRTVMSPKAINRLVTDTQEPHSPTLETLQALASGLNTTVAALLSPEFEAPRQPTGTLNISPNIAKQTGRLVEDFLICSEEDRMKILVATAEAASKASA